MMSEISSLTLKLELMCTCYLRENCPMLFFAKFVSNRFVIPEVITSGRYFYNWRLKQRSKLYLNEIQSTDRQYFLIKLSRFVDLIFEFFPFFCSHDESVRFEP